MADNLKLKAEELIQKRVDRERRKHTEDFQLEKLVANREENVTDEGTDRNVTPTNFGSIRMIRGHHKDSVAKPLTEDSEDDTSPISRRRSPTKFQNNFRVSENVSRLMDDKRSTIKEQVEDEEEFTGSSLNISGNLQFIRSSKQCKKKSSDYQSRSSKRKNSDNLICSDNATPIGIYEKPRKYTDNLYESKRKIDKKRTKDHDNDNSTTIEGTSVITPFMYSRKDSGFEGYVGSMLSTPTMVKNKIKREVKMKEESDPTKSFDSQMTIFKTLASKSKEKKISENPPADN